MPPKPKSHIDPKDLFLHLLLMITLYAAAGGFIAIIFQLINYSILDSLTWGYYDYTLSSDALRSGIATLIITFPALMVVSTLLEREYRAHPAKRTLRLRTWLIYFTLLVTAVTIGGGLISIINTYLHGELTLRFLLKASSLLCVAGAIFGYYAWNLKDTVPVKTNRIIGIAVSVILTAALVCGLMVYGSPKEQRLYQYDRQRVSDLEQIQNEIYTYWTAEKELPQSLEVLQESTVIPTDPETAKPYVYRVKDSTHYELCATFSATSQYTQENPWTHTAGLKCFTRSAASTRVYAY